MLAQYVKKFMTENIEMLVTGLSENHNPKWWFLMEIFSTEATIA